MIKCSHCNVSFQDYKTEREQMWSMHIRLVGRDEDANPTLLWRKGGETHQAIWKHAESQGRAFPGWLFIAITYIFVSEGSRNVLLVPPSTPLVGQVPNLKSFLCVDELCTMKWHLASGWDQLLSHHRCKRSKEAEHRQSEMQKIINKEIWCFFLPDINFLFITFLIVQLFESNKWFLVRNMYKRSWQPQKDYNWHIFFVVLAPLIYIVLKLPQSIMSQINTCCVKGVVFSDEPTKTATRLCRSPLLYRAFSTSSSV